MKNTTILYYYKDSNVPPNNIPFAHEYGSRESIYSSLYSVQEIKKIIAHCEKVNENNIYALVDGVEFKLNT